MHKNLTHLASTSFWEHYHTLPSKIRDLADKNFDLLKQDANHPSLHLKKIGRYWSVRVGRKYRALAVEDEDCLIWFWIGSHNDYENLLVRKTKG